MFVCLQKLLNCLIIYSYKTNPSFSPCPWNLRSIGPSDFNLINFNEKKIKKGKSLAVGWNREQHQASTRQRSGSEGGVTEAWQSA